MNPTIFIVAGLFIALGLGGVLLALYRSLLADAARGRLMDGSEVIVTGQTPAFEAGDDREGVRTRRSRLLRHDGWWGIPAATLIVLALRWSMSIPWPYLLALFCLLMMTAWAIGDVLRQRKVRKLEQQLADAVDMMVAAVGAGAGLQAALEASAAEAAQPWKAEVGGMIRDIRLGRDPVDALMDLSQRLPLESVTLFCQTLAVNWRVGGRLAITLANVGRTIRDRIELSRRMTAMTTQARMSVISVVIVTYFIGALIWRNDPERMSGFVQSLIGQVLISLGMILQVVGAVWITYMSRPRF